MRREKRAPSSLKISSETMGRGLRVAVIILTGLAIYWPALQGDWLWDDHLLIAENRVVHDPAGLWRIWFDPGSMIDFQPVKFSVVWLQWQLWGARPLGYHLTNLALHLIGALLIWRLLARFGLRQAWLGGLIFAVHPALVESVAWMAELKNTLSLPPFLIAVLCYLDYEERGRVRDYLLALGWFLIAMLVKPTMVMFPFVILLHAWWKQGRLGWRDLKAGAPFLVISLVLGWIAIVVLHAHTSENSMPVLGGASSRLACAGLSLTFYFWKSIWPVGLMPIYPKWDVDPPSVLQFLPWMGWVGVIGWCWLRRKTWGRHALLGLGFFILMLLPFLGFVAGSYMMFTWVMDHVVYIPIIGLIGLAVAGIDAVGRKIPATYRPAGGGIIGATILLMAWQGRVDAARYQSQETLWTYALEKNPEAWVGCNILGNVRVRQGRLDEAIAFYERSLRLQPRGAEAENNLGGVFGKMGQKAEARNHLLRAEELDPEYADSYGNMGQLLMLEGRLPEAIDQFQHALQLNPDYVEAHSNQGIALQKQGRLAEAAAQFDEALRLDPACIDAHMNLGVILVNSGHLPEAKQHFEQAVQLDPQKPEAHNNLAGALYLLGEVPESIRQWEIALSLDPGNASARSNLEKVRAGAGR